jgi:hypothetical protein
MDAEHKPVTIAEVTPAGRPSPRTAWPAAIAASWTPRVLAVLEGEIMIMGAIEPRLRCDRCGARFPRVGLRTLPRMTSYKA